jgi:hypothetical protein
MKSQIWAEAEKVDLVAGEYKFQDLTMPQLELSGAADHPLFHNNLEYLEWKANEKA